MLDICEDSGSQKVLDEKPIECEECAAEILIFPEDPGHRVFHSHTKR